MTESLMALDGRMLRYLGLGERWYGLRPQLAYRRSSWELQAVVAGELTPLFEGGPAAPQRQCLWAFPPQLSHGWTGRPSASCEVVVFHFVSLPELLRRACLPAPGYLRVDLSREEVHLVRSLGQQAQQELHSPTALSQLYFQQLQLQLSLLILRQRPPPPLPDRQAAAQARVEQALAWMEEHLHEPPSLLAVTKAIGISPAHLRRLFHQVRDCSPRQALHELRVRRALELLEQRQLSTESIAEHCGLGSASALSRAFKKFYGCSPRAWLQRAQVKMQTQPAQAPASASLTE